MCGFIGTVDTSDEVWKISQKVAKHSDWCFCGTNLSHSTSIRVGSRLHVALSTYQNQCLWCEWNQRRSLLPRFCLHLVNSVNQNCCATLQGPHSLRPNEFKFLMKNLRIKNDIHITIGGEAFCTWFLINAFFHWHFTKLKHFLSIANDTKICYDLQILYLQLVPGTFPTPSQFTVDFCMFNDISNIIYSCLELNNSSSLHN